MAALKEGLTGLQAAKQAGDVARRDNAGLREAVVQLRAVQVLRSALHDCLKAFLVVHVINAGRVWTQHLQHLGCRLLSSARWWSKQAMQGLCQPLAETTIWLTWTMSSRYPLDSPDGAATTPSAASLDQTR